MCKSHNLLVFILFSAWTAIHATSLSGQSGVFDRTGAIAGRGSYSSLPEESVDLFSGNLTLSHRDIFLPGPNGLNIELWRVYNSKVLYDKLASQPTPSVQAYPKTMIGIGWTMHMGLVRNAFSLMPVIEFPDGRRETAFPPKTEYNWGSSYRITRDFLKYYGQAGSDPKLYFQNGVVWTFGNVASLPLANGSTETVYMVTKIEDPCGHFIDIEYDPDDNFRSIKRITDRMGREVRFIKIYQGSEPAKLAEIRVRNYDDTHDVVYGYSVGSFPNGFYKLVSFTPPQLPATTYDYNDGLSNNYELTRVTTSYGGVLEYSYDNQTFFLSTVQLDSRVVRQKRITFNPGDQAKVWNYTYPTYQAVSSGTARVDGPEFSAEITSYAYSSQYPWRIGLKASEVVSDGSSSAAFTWTFYEVSNTTWSSFGVPMGKARGPLLSSLTQSRTGDSTLRQDVSYLRPDVTRYGLPTKLSFFINDSPSAKSVKELTYFYETHPSFKAKYMLAFVEAETDKAGDGSKLRETIMSYFEETGKWGALKQVKRLKSGSTYYTWDYGYDAPNPNFILISIDGPGYEGLTQVTYHYGVENEVSAPTFLKYTRSVSK